MARQELKPMYRMWGGGGDLIPIPNKKPAVNVPTQETGEGM
jgi:hypothetical protein